MIRDRGVDLELLNQLDDMLRRAEDQGLDTLSEKEIMTRLKRHWPDKKNVPSLSEVRRALQALVMEEQNMPNEVFGQGMDYKKAYFGNWPLDRQIHSSVLKSEGLRQTIPTNLDSNLTIGLGQN